MQKYNLFIDDVTAEFYKKAAKSLGTTPEELMEKALFITAGELSLSMQSKKENQF